MKYGEKFIALSKLETWENPYPRRDYRIEIAFPEFTCLCPRSGYPDFATIRINYIPKKYIVELKSLKLYLNSYRGEYISHEAVTNRIYDAVVKTIKPKYLEVIGDFNPRGNMKTVVMVTSDNSK
ncbi:MAG: preQ(1) synthase [Nitrospirota bacterium]